MIGACHPAGWFFFLTRRFRLTMVRMMKKKVAVVGASGYSGEELVRLLMQHPQVELTAVTSRQSAGLTVGQVFPKFASHAAARSLRFTEPNAELLSKQAEIVFLALPHGVAAEFAVPLINAGCVSRRSAEWHSAVSRIGNPQRLASSGAPRPFQTQPNAIRRNSRVPLCATAAARPATSNRTPIPPRGLPCHWDGFSFSRGASGSRWCA